jgi:hypothetical protein
MQPSMDGSARRGSSVSSASHLLYNVPRRLNERQARTRLKAALLVANSASKVSSLSTTTTTTAATSPAIGYASEHYPFERTSCATPLSIASTPSSSSSPPPPPPSAIFQSPSMVTSASNLSQSNAQRGKSLSSSLSRRSSPTGSSSSRTITAGAGSSQSIQRLEATAAIAALDASNSSSAAAAAAAAAVTSAGFSFKAKATSTSPSSSSSSSSLTMQLQQKSSIISAAFQSHIQNANSHIASLLDTSNNSATASSGKKKFLEYFVPIQSKTNYSAASANQSQISNVIIADREATLEAQSLNESIINKKKATVSIINRDENRSQLNNDKIDGKEDETQQKQQEIKPKRPEQLMIAPSSSSLLSNASEKAAMVNATTTTKVAPTLYEWRQKRQQRQIWRQFSSSDGANTISEGEESAASKIKSTSQSRTAEKERHKGGQRRSSFGGAQSSLYEKNQSQTKTIINANNSTLPQMLSKIQQKQQKQQQKRQQQQHQHQQGQYSKRANSLFIAVNKKAQQYSNGDSIEQHKQQSATTEASVESEQSMIHSRARSQSHETTKALNQLKNIIEHNKEDKGKRVTPSEESILGQQVLLIESNKRMTMTGEASSMVGRRSTTDESSTTTPPLQQHKNGSIDSRRDSFSSRQDSSISVTDSEIVRIAAATATQIASNVQHKHDHQRRRDLLRKAKKWSNAIDDNNNTNNNNNNNNSISIAGEYSTTMSLSIESPRDSMAAVESNNSSIACIEEENSINERSSVKLSINKSRTTRYMSISNLDSKRPIEDETNQSPTTSRASVDLYQSKVSINMGSSDSSHQFAVRPSGHMLMKNGSSSSGGGGGGDTAAVKSVQGQAEEIKSSPSNSLRRASRKLPELPKSKKK